MAYRIVLLLLLPVFCFGQNITADKINLRQSVTLKGVRVDSFSKDGTFTTPVHTEIPTQKAIYDYISGITAGLAYLPIQGGTLTGTAGAGFITYPTQSSNPSAPANGFAFFADATGRPSWRRADGFVRTIDASTITASRVYTLPDASGTFGLLGSTQSWSGINTFTNKISQPVTLTSGGDIAKSMSLAVNPTANGQSFTGLKITSTLTSGGFTGTSVIPFEVRFSDNSTPLSIQEGTVKYIGIGTAGGETRFAGLVTIPGAASTSASVSQQTTFGFRIQQNGQTSIRDDNTNDFVTGSAILELKSTVRGVMFPKPTTAQRDAYVTPADLLVVMNQSTRRMNYYNSSLLAWVEVPSMPSGGLGSGRIVYTNASGDLTSVANFLYSDVNGQITLPASTGIRGSSLYTHIFNAGGSSGNISFGFGQDPTTTANRLVTIRQTVDISGGISTGAINTFLIHPSYAWPSGNATATALVVAPTLNFTGTYLGTVRGIYYNPTLTSMIGVTHNAIEITSGNILFQGTGTTTLQNGTLFDTGAGNRMFNSNKFQIQSNSTTDAGIVLNAGVFHSASSGFSGVRVNSSNTQSPLTSGTLSIFQVTGRASYSGAGSANVTAILVNPTFDNASGNTGVARGVYYAGSATNAIHRAWESTSGNFIINGGQVGIGISTPHASALVDMTSTTQGLLVPRMTAAQRNATTPADLLIIGNITTGRPNFYFNSAWWAVMAGPDGGIPLHQISTGDANGNLVSSINFRYNAGLLTTGTTDFRLGAWSTATTANLLARRNIVGYWHNPTSFSTGLVAQDSINQRYTTFVTNSTDGSIISKNGATGAQTSFVVTPTETTTDNKAVFTSAVYTSGTSSSSGTSYNVPGNVNYAHVDGTTIVTVNLPEIVSNPDILANQVGVGASIDLSIANSLAIVTINRAGSSDLIVVDGMTTTPAASVLTTAAVTFARRARAVSVDLWVIY